jgi:hypothetical protein
VASAYLITILIRLFKTISWNLSAPSPSLLLQRVASRIHQCVDYISGRSGKKQADREKKMIEVLVAPAFTTPLFSDESLWMERVGDEWVDGIVDVFCTGGDLRALDGLATDKVRKSTLAFIEGRGMTLGCEGRSVDFLLACYAGVRAGKNAASGERKRIYFGVRSGIVELMRRGVECGFLIDMLRE